MIGQTLGSYPIVEQVEAGGMATVYKAWDPNTGRYIAVKTLPEKLSRDPNNGSADVQQDCAHRYPSGEWDDVECSDWLHHGLIGFAGK